MPETPIRRASPASWLRALVVVIAVLAVALGIGADRHHADELVPASAPAAAVAQLAADAGDPVDALGALDGAAIGGIAAVCAIALLCCLAILRRRSSTDREAAPDGWVASVPRPRPTHPVFSFAPVPQLAVLSISRT